MRNRWLWTLLVLLLVVVVANFALDGRMVMAVGYGVLALGIAWWTSPWRGRRGSTQQEVEQMVQDDASGVVVYWRPGCGYCAMLKARLGGLRDKATWVNIWDDEDAAAFVRGVNDGNEVVPTVVIDGVALTNPDPVVVKERLQRV